MSDRDSIDNGECSERMPDGALRFSGKEQEGSVAVEVDVGIDAPVGRWVLRVWVRKSEVYESRVGLGVLFNPYASGEQVAQSRENIAEYVESDETVIWYGGVTNPGAMVWDLAQFEWGNMEVTLDSIRRMPVSWRSDAVLVSRHISWSVGADICYGRWESPYDGDGFTPPGGYTCGRDRPCHAPGYWTGSTAIFRLHKALKAKVQFCQCWVFGAVTSTITRGLGMPSRVITTFRSAHDSDKNRAIEKYATKSANGRYKVLPSADSPTGDSVWNFHAWNEVYLKRPDLAKSQNCQDCADGWQVIDATPQEYSTGGGFQRRVYALGPASLRMIKRNLHPSCDDADDVAGCYDHEFVISEVNADENLWVKEQGRDDWVLESRSQVDTFGQTYMTAGQRISTKAKGRISSRCRRYGQCNGELDHITSSYKEGEPSGAGQPYNPNAGPCNYRGHYCPQGDLTTARSATLAALPAAPKTVTAPLGTGVSPIASNPVINHPSHPANAFTVELPIVNSGSSPETVDCSFLAYVQPSYNGKNAILVGESNEAVVVPAGKNVTCSLTVSREQYRKYAVTALDVARGSWGAKEGLKEMPSSEKAYAISVKVVASSSSGIVHMGERETLICTPQNEEFSGLIMCEGKRGFYTPEKSHGASFTIAPPPADAKDNGEDVCVGMMQSLKQRLQCSSNATCDAACASSVHTALCDEEGFASAFAQCEADIQSALGSCDLPRCAPRTERGCQCKKEWTLREAGSGLLGSFSDHSCASHHGTPWGTPKDPLRSESWCEVVPGSCVLSATEAGFRSEGFCECPKAFDGCPEGKASCSGCELVETEGACVASGRVWRAATQWDSCISSWAARWSDEEVSHPSPP